jgi:hypothetical protein
VCLHKTFDAIVPKDTKEARKKSRFALHKNGTTKANRKKRLEVRMEMMTG